MLYNAYNREPQTWFCVIRQISRISKSGVFKGGISPSGLSPLALYADYPFIISSYAIYIGQEKPPDGTTYFAAWHDTLPAVPTSVRTDVSVGGKCCCYISWHVYRDDREHRIGEACSGDAPCLSVCGSAWKIL